MFFFSFPSQKSHPSERTSLSDMSFARRPRGHTRVRRTCIHAYVASHVSTFGSVGGSARARARGRDGEKDRERERGRSAAATRTHTHTCARCVSLSLTHVTLSRISGRRERMEKTIRKRERETTSIFTPSKVASNRTRDLLILFSLSLSLAVRRIFPPDRHSSSITRR